MRAELSRELFEPRRKVGGGADAGAIQPIAAADVPVENLSDVQRNAEPHAVVAGQSVGCGPS